MKCTCKSTDSESCCGLANCLFKIDAENSTTKDKHHYCIRRPFRRFFSFLKRRTKSITWGISEGLASGALSGCNLASAGGWFFGTINQIVGSIIGAIGGTTAGFLAGTVADQRTLICVFESYRKNYGIGRDTTLKR